MTITETIRQHIHALPQAEPFTAKQLLRFGQRAAVDQALSRLCRAGSIRRVMRGVYAKPTPTAWGERLPETYEIVRSVATAQGEVVAPHGAVAVNRFGLSTQNPMRLVLLTSGRSKVMQVRGQEVRLKHVAPSRLLEANTLAGLAVTALRYLGREQASLVQTQRIVQQLPEIERQRLQRITPSLPAWMIRLIAEVGNGTGDNHE